MRRRGLLRLVCLFSAACGPTVPFGSAEGRATGDIASTESTTSTGGDPSASSSSTGNTELVCEPDAVGCDGSEYGIWRLSSPTTPVVGYLYLWPDGNNRPYSFTGRWYVDDPEQEYCIRNGTYVGTGDLESNFVFQTDGQGGTATVQCGGDPDAQALRLALTRRPECEGEVFTLEASASNGASLYTFEGEAVHCGCDFDHDPYAGMGEPIPFHTCVQP